MKIFEFEERLGKLTAGDLYWLSNELAGPFGQAPYIPAGDSKKDNIRSFTRWVRGDQVKIDAVLNKVSDRLKEIAEYKAAPKIVAGTTVAAGQTMESTLDSILPEWRQVRTAAGSEKPKKFMERISIRVCPAKYNPTALGDFAYAKLFSWDGRSLTSGPSFSVDSLLNVSGGSYAERVVNVPKGTRVWNTVFDGQWGGYWSTVDVYVSPEDQLASGAKGLLK